MPDDPDNGQRYRLGEEGSKEHLQWQAAWPLFAVAWCGASSARGVARLALGSFIEGSSGNYIQVVDLVPDAGVPKRRCEPRHTRSLVYPCTKLLWEPAYEQCLERNRRDRLASAGDFLRLWAVSEESMVLLASLKASNRAEQIAPLTAMDWNEVDRSALATASVDTTVAVWDPDLGRIRTQLIAHDNAVYDISFDQSTAHHFVTCGADGSVRLFDLRSLDHSTVLYESPTGNPLLRVSWNRQNNHYLLTLPSSSRFAVVLDIRMPAMPMAYVGSHEANLNALSWSPSSMNHLATADMDGRVALWELYQTAPKGEVRTFAECGLHAPVDNLAWSAALPEWIAAVVAPSSVHVLQI
jgi:WD repeat-containing protein 68